MKKKTKMSKKKPSNQVRTESDSVKLENLRPVTINPRAIIDIAKKAGDFVFTPEAEVELVKLLKMQKLIEDMLEQVKNQIAKAGISIDKDFKGVIGEKVRTVYRKYGSKYGYRRDQEKKLTEFLKEVSYNKVDSEKVEKYIEEVGELPDGIFTKDRKKQLSITVTEEDLLEE